jgi:hypothetical protein
MSAQFKNRYRTTFMLKCPNNDRIIRYALEIESNSTIMVENIIAAVDALPFEGFQEDIADQLAAALPGKHILIAHHHGVDIETRRGSET